MISFAFLAVWTLVGWFTYFTFILREHAKNSNRDKKWGFGQILTLATCVPFIVKFAYMWWEEPEEAQMGGSLIHMRSSRCK
jgi:heme/copper-type cytochrome/quinol oxidase subunit 2